MDLGLKGKRAVVCGGSRGLGRAVAVELLREGAEVLIAARGREGLQQAAEEMFLETQRRPLISTADLADPRQREELFCSICDQLGKPEILVANAGGPPAGSFEQHGSDAWQNALELALGVSTHLIRLALPAMKANGFGRILQIVSIAGLEVLDGLMLSNAARPAVLGFGKALAREVAPHGILINSLCPGIFLTGRVRELVRQQSQRTGITEGQALDHLTGDIPLGRPGKPAELGAVAAFLCSPLNSYMTGSVIVVDGGKTRRLF